jgi:Mycobacterium membrane protein
MMIVQFTGGSSGPATWGDVHLPTTKHHVVYEVTGQGTSPDLKLIDGVNGTETVKDADLPWHEEFVLEVGPGLGMVQVLATNKGTAEEISCSVSVDGNVVHKTTASGQWSSVAYSSVIRPNTE